MRISDWSSDVCSSDLLPGRRDHLSAAWHLAAAAPPARAGEKAMSGSDLLVVDGISKSFRGLRAVTRASLAVPEGGIVSLIGPPGAAGGICSPLEIGRASCRGRVCQYV